MKAAESGEGGVEQNDIGVEAIAAAAANVGISVLSVTCKL
jgi:hypothetical protein